MSTLLSVDPSVAQLIDGEAARQAAGLELIPSENYASTAVREALGSVFTNKYSEGYPGKRYYGGQEFTDQVETLAIDRAKKLFGAEHTNVQPLSGAPANLAVYAALLKPGDTVMGMDLSHGGHLTHGHPVTLPAHLYTFVRYKMADITTGAIDYDQVRALALEHKPKLIIAGFSSYPGLFDYGAFVDIAKEVGAITMADVAHTAGLIAGGVVPNPFAAGFDIVTTTTHKTLRGPRGGLIMSKTEYASTIDKAVFPGLQGGPHMNNVAAKAVAFHEAAQPEFAQYAQAILDNAQVLARELLARGVTLITGGTQNHLLLLDVMASFSISGQQAQSALEAIGITSNMNVLPDDVRGARDPSGLRIGTPALTTRGAKAEHMTELADILVACLTVHDDIAQQKLKSRVAALAHALPIPV